jgi:hypothetical protein
MRDKTLTADQIIILAITEAIEKLKSRRKSRDLARGPLLRATLAKRLRPPRDVSVE